AINYGNSLGVVGFDNAMKTNVLAGKIVGRFTPSNPFNNSAENPVNTPALFI
ncbi:11356_t:CDS:1, partial [Funneliformis geosporum]